MTATADDRFRHAARAYFVYGLVYAVGATYLFRLGLGRGLTFGVVFVLVGWTLVVLIPFLLSRRRAMFERWILSRRDFARILAVLVALRAVLVARIALTGAESMRMPSFGGGVPTRGAGAWLMAAIAAATAVMLAIPTREARAT